METRDVLNDSFEGYQRSVRERATDSMYGLRNALSSQPAVSPEMRRRTTTDTTAWERPRYTEHSDYSYSSAQGRLKSMLQQYESRDMYKDVQFDSRISLKDLQASPGRAGTHVPLGEAPSPQEAVKLLKNQTALIENTTETNKFLQKELQSLKQKMVEVIAENRALHEELKRGTVQELLREGVPGIASTSLPTIAHQRVCDELDLNVSLTKRDYTMWHSELERICALHTAKSARLEAQLAHASEEQSQYEREVDELRSKVRMLEALSTTDPHLSQMAAGLCVRCAEHEAVLAPGNRQTVHTLTRERDELMEQLTALRARYSELRRREEEAYQQVKSSVHLTEQAQLEMTQAFIEREQLKEELTQTRQRMGQHVEEVLGKVQEERENARAESRKERDNLHNKVKELECKHTELQMELDKLARDKIMLLAQLETHRGQIDTIDLDYGKATDNMKMSLTQATVERKAAVDHTRRMRQEMDQQERDRDNERVRLKTEVAGLRSRLSVAEKELVESKEECVQLYNTTQALEREVHVAKLCKESLEKNRSDDLKTVTRRAENRENQLNTLITKMEAKHADAIRELQEVANSQSILILKLREECRKVAGQLEDTTVKYRTENKQLRGELSAVRSRYEAGQKRQRELEECSTQHGLLQEKMRERMREVDQRSSNTAQQVLELLASESGLLKDRQLLASEVEFLRRQLVNIAPSISSTKHLVDDILNTVRHSKDKRLNDDILNVNNHAEVKVSSVGTPSEEDIDDLLMES